MSAMENLDSLVTQAQTAIGSANDAKALDDVRVQFLGKKGEITQLLLVVRPNRPDLLHDPVPNS